MGTFARMLALDSLFGLPAHLFLVHIPVVLIPLGALGAVLMLWPRLRSTIGWWVCGILVVAGIATQLAITSGKSLRNTCTRAVSYGSTHASARTSARGCCSCSSRCSG